MADEGGLKYWGLRELSFFERCEGETITVRLMTGKTLPGPRAPTVGWRRRWC